MNKTLAVSRRRRIALPALLRRRLGIKAGSRETVVVGDGDQGNPAGCDLSVLLRAEEERPLA